MKKNIIEVVQNMERTVSERSPGCVFRGEPACFDKVSSGLYRTYGLEKGEGEFNIETVESEMVEKARAFTDRKDPFDILCEIQHRGGKTNQIDFTRDIGVALFFACGTTAEREHEPGRVIMLNDSEQARSSGISIRDITHPIHMAAAQKSVFVSTDTGYLNDRHLPNVQIWTIDADEKQEVLKYLKGSRGIDSRSIFMDISGFIRHAHEFENATAWLYRGRRMLVEGDLDKTIEAASNFIRLSDPSIGPYSGLYIRGRAYYRKGDWDRAFQDLRRIQRLQANLEGTDGGPVYPLPPQMQKELAAWCEEQERIEKENRRKAEKAQDRKRDGRMLKCIIRVIPEGDVEQPASFTFDFYTNTGYSYRQIISQGSDNLVNWPSTFLDHEAACWWSFYGPEHQHVSTTRKTVPEDLDVSLVPKPSSAAAPCTIHVRFFAYNATKQELRQKDSGEYELIPLT